MHRPHRARRGRPLRRGLTLIEVMIALAIAAMAVGVAITGVSSLTSASLRSSALELAGTIKLAYDRAIMARHTERLSLDLDKGLFWLDYTEDQFTVAREREAGREGAKNTSLAEAGEPGERRKDEDDEDFFADDAEDGKAEVLAALEGGKAIAFQADIEIFQTPDALPSDVRISKVWTGHQEEAFTSGVAYVHFFNSGFSEPAQIELTDGEEYVTITVYPLTGRVRIHDKQLEVPKPSDDDGRDEGDE